MRDENPASGSMKRRLSWVVGALAYIAPPAWAYFEQASIYESAREQHGYVCGLPMLAIISLASIAAALLSAIALLLGSSAFRALPRPRPKTRAAELAVLGVPLVMPLALLGFLIAY